MDAVADTRHVGVMFNEARIDCPVSTRADVRRTADGGWHVDAHPEQRWTHLLMRADRFVARAPTDPVLSVEPGGWYRLRVRFPNGAGSDRLWIYEYDDTSKVRHFRAIATADGYEHIWPVSPTTRQICLSLTSSGDLVIDEPEIELTCIEGVSAAGEIAFEGGRSDEETALDRRVEHVILDRFLHTPEGREIWPILTRRVKPAKLESGHDLLARLTYCASILPRGGSVLEAGPGFAEFLYLLADLGNHESLRGVDLMAYRSALLEPDCPIDFDIMSMTALSYPDRSFDVVACLQVLEHVDWEQFEEALPELRRVCRGQLFISVPFKEREPLSGAHRIRFAEPEIARYFPTARKTLMHRGHLRYPCILLVEDFSNAA